MTDTTTLHTADGRTFEIPNDRLDPAHYVTLNGQTWHMSHPIECDLKACPFDEAARGWELPPDLPGRYRWATLDERPVRVQA